MDDLRERDIVNLLLAYCVYTVCFTVILCLLFVAMWEYRVFVGFLLLTMLAILVLAHAEGEMLEHDIRWLTFQQQRELPKPKDEEPEYMTLPEEPPVQSSERGKQHCLIVLGGRREKE